MKISCDGGVRGDLIEGVRYKFQGIAKINFLC
jgi:hypothetical protein